MLQGHNWPKIPRRLDGLAGDVQVLRPVYIPCEPGRVQLGEWDAEARKIKVKSTLSRESSWYYYLHEALHSFIDDAGLTLDPDLEEAVCNTGASGMKRLIYGAFLE
jgi:hypothetical protein